MLEEREVLLQEMEGAEITERSLPQWKNLENALKRLDAQVISAHNELKLLTFHYQLLNQDFQVLHAAFRFHVMLIALEFSSIINIHQKVYQHF